MFKKLTDILKVAKQKPERKLVIAAAEDKHVLEAVKAAVNEKLIIPIFIGDTEKINAIAKEIQFDISECEKIKEPDPQLASKLAVKFVREGKADFLMKGLVGTSTLLKAVLDKEKGIRKNMTMSHVAIFENKSYHKLLGLTDAAMNIAPDLNEKINIINNAVEVFHKLGIETPKVALLTAVETVNPKMPATTDAALLAAMNKRKQIKGCVIDGPLALDNAISEAAAKTKGIVSEVAGDADILVAPDIEAGNIMYKTMNFLGGSISAAVIMGARVPIVLTSRADSEKSKLMSIALAKVIAEE